MEENQIKKLYDILDRMEDEGKNSVKIQEIRDLIKEGSFVEALEKINGLEDEPEEELEKIKVKKNEDETKKTIYPPKLQNNSLEEKYIGILLDNPKLITKYYILHEDCYFEDQELLNIYKAMFEEVE